MRTLAEGTALLLATTWQRSPADLKTIFVPLAGAAMERQVSAATWAVAVRALPAGISLVCLARIALTSLFLRC
jgi:hypothetical protein